MKTKIVLIFCVFVTVFALLITFKSIKEKQESTSVADSVIAQGETMPLDQQTSQNSDSSSLKVGDGSGVNQGPTQAEFAEYDKHKTDQSLGYVEQQVGIGALAEDGKKVVVNYKGWLTNGTLFDQTKEAKPFMFTLGAHEVISGWDQGILGMKVGSKRRLVIPSSLGYGANGAGPIPGGALLVFDVELLAVQ